LFLTIDISVKHGLGVGCAHPTETAAGGGAHKESEIDGEQRASWFWMEYVHRRGAEVEDLGDEQMPPRSPTVQHYGAAAAAY